MCLLESWIRHGVTVTMPWAHGVTDWRDHENPVHQLEEPLGLSREAGGKLCVGNHSLLILREGAEFVFLSVAPKGEILGDCHPKPELLKVKEQAKPPDISSLVIARSWKAAA
ncbi:hypothetical protein DUI87_21059 [Hirundo rustica rustica]|uniref:Uncharacterized protein n=1 Tax=Hirundo rustica rustica TaxID=333673 RepID=A0A3M0JLE5_HIRRU|nr:hypothetical protein DUI87_21059 [Hirundo rustica rustica]